MTERPTPRYSFSALNIHVPKEVADTFRGLAHITQEAPAGFINAAEVYANMLAARAAQTANSITQIADVTEVGEALARTAIKAITPGGRNA